MHFNFIFNDPFKTSKDYMKTLILLCFDKKYKWLCNERSQNVLPYLLDEICVIINFCVMFHKQCYNQSSLSYAKNDRVINEKCM